MCPRGRCATFSTAVPADRSAARAPRSKRYSAALSRIWDSPHHVPLYKRRTQCTAVPSLSQRPEPSRPLPPRHASLGWDSATPTGFARSTPSCCAMTRDSAGRGGSRTEPSSSRRASSRRSPAGAPRTACSARCTGSPPTPCVWRPSQPSTQALHGVPALTSTRPSLSQVWHVRGGHVPRLGSLDAHLQPAREPCRGGGRRRGHEAVLGRPARPVVRVAGTHAARERFGEVASAHRIAAGHELRGEGVRTRRGRTALHVDLVLRPGRIQRPGVVRLDRTGEHERAESCLHRTLAAIPDDMVRNKALYTAHLSLSQARQGEVELAAGTGRRAYEMLLPASGSLRTTRTLAVTRQVIEATGTKASEAVSWIEESGRWI